ncbi:MAG: Maf family nucleotide pyrophosphatase [Burkholderiales bacterium]
MSKTYENNLSVPQLVLASTSPYRRELLERLRIPFSIVAPNVDETPLRGELPEQTAARLAQAKAAAAAKQRPQALIIGCDQVAALEGSQLDKPHTHENAFKQLQLMRGKTAMFYTAVCLLNAATGNTQIQVIPNQVRFRRLSDVQIANYLAKEQPYHCAGSAKTEGLGIALIEAMHGEDPWALIGLPLITLVDMLKNEGLEVV